MSFIPYSIQRRILRYALSHIDVLDTDALDLERLDIAWGRQNVVELRDVALRAQKLRAILQLPPNLDLSHAAVRLLRVSIPTDLHVTPIRIEVRGVDLQITVDAATQAGDPHPSPSDPADDDDGLPTARDLARSFLAEEPADEKKELEDALESQSASLYDSEPEDDAAVGTGTGLSLPVFLTNWLKGVGDRLELTVHDVACVLDPGALSCEHFPAVGGQADHGACLRLHIDGIEIEGVTAGSASSAPDTGIGPRRRVVLQNVIASLIAEAKLFVAPLRSAEPSVSSPSECRTASEGHPVVESVHSGGFGSMPGSEVQERPSSPRPSRATTQSPTASPLLQQSPPRRKDPSEDLKDSIITQDADRFADADDDSPVASSSPRRPFAAASRDIHSTALDPEHHFDDNEASDIMGESFWENDPEQATASRRFQDWRRGRQGVGSPSDSDGSLPLPLRPAESATSTKLDFPLTSSIPADPHPEDLLETSLSHSELIKAAPSSPSGQDPASQSSSLSIERPSLSKVPSSSNSSGSDMGELAESHLYTREEAESMYMSAMSEATPEMSSGPELPGRWAASPPRSNTDLPSIPALSDAAHQAPARQVSDERETLTPRARSPASEGDADAATEAIEATPTKADAAAGSTAKTSRDFLMVDELVVWIPTGEPGLPTDTRSAEAPKESSEANFPHLSTDASFSEYATATAARRRPTVTDTWQSTTSIRPDESRMEDPGAPMEPKHPLGLEASKITSQLDTTTARVLFFLIRKLIGQLDSKLPESEPSDTPATTTSADSTPSPLKFQAGQLILSFVEEMSDGLASFAGVDTSSSFNGRPVIVVDMGNIDVTIDDLLHPSKGRLDVGRFQVGNPNYKMLTLEETPSLKASTRVLKEVQTKAISARMMKKGDALDIGVSTFPVIFNLDMPLLDETLSAFGGLSGVLELSSSISSNGPVPVPVPAPSKPRKPQGVRFASTTPGVAQPSSNPSPKIKLNARIGGFQATLGGKSAAVALRTSPIKLIFRETVVGTQIDAIRLTCANGVFGAAKSPVTVDIENSRLEFLFAPDESDLTRLVSLITPSKDKYEDDDDILLDILLRQRKRGPVLRVTSGAAHIDIVNLEGVSQMQSLNEEISKLSTVTKYLPEDDSPGPLILCLVKEINVLTPVNDRFGNARVQCRNTQVAHVVFPPLSAAEIGTISVVREGEDELIRPVLHVPASQDSAMIMARMVGDEMEPTVKVKLHNVCCEYDVRTLMSILGLGEEGTVEELTTELAASVATITMPSGSAPARPLGSEQLDRPTSPRKPLQLDILLRDCAVGLNPSDSPAKALFLFTNTRLHGAIPVDSSIKAALEIRKASLLLIDDAGRLEGSVEVPARSNAVTFGESDHVRNLQERGYVSVCLISAAEAVIHVGEAADGTQAVEVDFKDELFVMETCADSTQTLLSIANGLKPKSPPISDELKYRTEVVPIEDMMASFTGEAFMDKERDPVTLDDIDFVGDDLPADLEFVGSFYDPTAEKSPGYSEQHSRRRRASSASSHKSANVGEAFQETILADPTSENIAFKVDYLLSSAPSQRGLRQWDSKNNAFILCDEFQGKAAPLQVHVRDVNVIWNLFDGYDWPKTRDIIGKAVQDIEDKAEERRQQRRVSAEPEEEETVGDFLFNSIWIEVPANREPADLRRQINRNIDEAASETESYATTSTARTATARTPAPRKRRRLRLERSKHHKVTFELRGVAADLVVYSPGSGETQLSVDLRVHDLEIFDHVPSSTWKKFCTYMHDAGERQLGKPMVRLEVQSVRPVPELSASELVVRVNVLPLRLHVDQDALEFITRFFEFKDDASAGKDPATPPSDDLFIQRIDINAVRLRLDYKPKKVDYGGIRSGHTTEFMNFFILDQADILLRRVILYGVSGPDKLHDMLNDIWLPDVKRNQLPQVLAGLAPVRPIVNVGGGVRNLVVVPFREYKKDGRVVRSIQKGAVAFARTTTGEMARLGAKVAIGAHNFLSGAEELLSPIVPGTSSPHGESDWEDAPYPAGSASPGGDTQRAVSNYANQPMGVVAGLRGAARSLERDLLTARDAIVAIPAEVIESANATGAAAAVARRAPTVILRPVMGASKAIGLTLLGASNALDKDSQRKMDEKYKRY